jgi:hypothetical protein
MPRAWIVFCLWPALICTTTYCQELAFTSRVSNDGPRAVTAVRFQVTFRSGAGDEIAEERRVPVSLERHDSRCLLLGLAQMDSLRQQAKAQKQESALVILTIEAIEFEDGGEWKQTEPERGIPIDPLPPQKPGPRTK